MKNKKIIIVLILGIITFANSYLIAKYTTSVSGSNSASVAKWDVTYNTNGNQSDTLNLVSGNTTQDYTINVTSTSEVSANYSIVLTNVPNDMEVKIDNGAYQTPINNKIEFNNVGTFSANSMNTTHTHVLTFNALIESNVSTTNVGINIKFNQID